MNADYFIIDNSNEVLCCSDNTITIYGDKQEAIDEMMTTDKLGTLLYHKDKDGNRIAEVYIDSSYVGEFADDDKDAMFQHNFKQFLIEHQFNLLAW